MLNREQIKELLETTEELLSQLEDKLEDQCNCCSNESEDQSNERGTTLLEDLITNFVAKCLKENRLPTLQEAQVIHILDDINSKYN